MSTTHNTYVLYGTLFHFSREDGLYDLLEPYIDNAYKPERLYSETTVLFDGFDGKYIAIGAVFQRSEAGQGFYEPVTLPQVHPKFHEVVQDEIMRLSKGLIPFDRLGWHVITHYR